MEDGSYLYYNVLTQDSATVSFPDNAEKIKLSKNKIYYITPNSDDTSYQLYRQDYMNGEKELCTEKALYNYNLNLTGYALLFSDPSSDEYSVAVIDEEKNSETIFSQKSFSSESVLELSDLNIYVLEPDGTIWFSPIAREDWKTTLSEH